MRKCIPVEDVHVFRVGSVQEYRDKLSGSLETPVGTIYGVEHRSVDVCSWVPAHFRDYKPYRQADDCDQSSNKRVLASIRDVVGAKHAPTMRQAFCPAASGSTKSQASELTKCPVSSP